MGQLQAEKNPQPRKRNGTLIWAEIETERINVSINIRIIFEKHTISPLCLIHQHQFALTKFPYCLIRPKFDNLLLRYLIRNLVIAASQVVVVHCCLALTLYSRASQKLILIMLALFSEYFKTVYFCSSRFRSLSRLVDDYRLWKI